MKKRDRILGMDRDISRRDFLNGVNIAVAGSLLSAPAATALGAMSSAALEHSAQMLPGYYPPAQEGLRGSHIGSFEVAHTLRDGKQWGDSVDTGEEYDLVVVGGGLSGLAAAYFYQKQLGPEARILIIENHDDFGGHAKRNEFHYKGRTLIDLGGAEYIEAPWSYPESASSLLEDLGVDVNLANKVFDHSFFASLNLRGGVFFDEKTFGSNKLVAGAAGLSLGDQQPSYITLPAELEQGVGNKEDIEAFLRDSPLSDTAREQVVELFCGGQDYLTGKSKKEKLALLRRMTYMEFLIEIVGARQEVIDFLWMWRGSYMGNGVDLTPALAAMRYGLPGAVGLDLVDATRRPERFDAHSFKDDFHFPDGNASVARLIVRRLIPDVAPGNSMHDIISANFDYGMLDTANSPVRIRLNSTAVNVRHLGTPSSARQVEVTYVQENEARRVRGRHCVLACYHAIIPYICDELPPTQSDALRKTIRMPLVSTNVLVDNWTAFEKAGIFAAYCPGSYFSDVRLTYPLRFADYRSSESPEHPTTVKMYRIPMPGGGASAASQFRAGRHDLLATSFETFERNIRGQLGAMLGDSGFDPARDIKGITVNRWPHGYAVGYDYENDVMNYFSEPWADDKKLWLSGRQSFGRIAIANSDAAASAMTEAAIDQGFRATQEILGKPTLKKQ